MVKYLFPPWYVYALTIKPTWWVVKKVFGFPLWALRRSKSRLSKLFWGALAVWIAIPGTIPLTLLYGASLVGYEKEAQVVMDAGMAVLKAAWAAGKFAFEMATA